VNVVATLKIGPVLEGHTVATATGHRPQDIAAYTSKGFDGLVDVAKKMIVDSNATLVIAGGAIGWDTAVAAAALDLDLPLVLAVPFPGHEGRWKAEDQALYKKHAAEAEAVVFVSDEAPGDDMDAVISYMEARNAFMVDSAQILLAFWSGKERGGTANCIRYAKRVRLPIKNGWTADWGNTPEVPLTVVSVSTRVTAQGYQVTLRQAGSDRDKVIRQSQLFHAIPVKGRGVKRDWKPSVGRRYGPNNPARLFFAGMLVGARAIKRADEVRFNLTPSQKRRVAALKVDACRKFRDRQSNSNTGMTTPVLHAKLKERLVTELARLPHNLGRLTSEADIVGFKDKYSWLSNFAPCKVQLDGAWYGSVEVAFQAAKTLNPEVRKEFARCSSAQAKAKGMTVELRPDWDDVKVSVMRRLLAQKFAPGTKLAALLHDTGTVRLIEENSWGDSFWGVSRGKGGNHLGKLLMELRR
jgi:ribA/ribD-fused uncharacterized protein